MRPTRMRPPGDAVIITTDNATSSCLAADSNTGDSWWHGIREIPANDTASRIPFEPAILTPEDCADMFGLRFKIHGIFDNADATPFVLTAGIFATEMYRDAEQVAPAVQTGVGVNDTSAIYSHSFTITPAVVAAGHIGLWSWTCDMYVGLMKQLGDPGFAEGLVAWKQYWESKGLWNPDTQRSTVAAAASTPHESQGWSGGFSGPIIRNANWTDATKTITPAIAGTLSNFAFVAGDKLVLTKGTNVVLGIYALASNTADVCVVTTDINTGGFGDITDNSINGYIFRDVNNRKSDFTRGVRLTPFIKKGTAVQTRILGVGGIITSIPEELRPGLNLGGLRAL